MRLKYWLLLFYIMIPCLAHTQVTQDSLTISLSEAESLFQKNNLQLLAQKFSIDSARANIITAKLYDNPDIGVSTGLYDQDTKKFFDYSYDNREISIQISQLIKTAGKRNKNITIAKTGSVMTEYAFFDLIRTLGYTLRNDFFNIYYLEQTQKAYSTEITSLQQTATAYEEQVKKGNIAQKDLLRIQSQLYTLQAELGALQNTIDDVQSEFKLLIRSKAMTYIVPVKIPEQDVRLSDIPFTALLDSAYHNRYDLKIAQTNIQLNRQNLALQKALAVPDITLNAGYDRLGSYVKNFNNIGFGFPLPFLNRNQGNIKQAKIGVSSSEVQLQSVQEAIESQVANAYIGAVRAEKLLKSFDPEFEDNFSFLIMEVTKNFAKRNISLLEFIDFYDSYKQNVVQLNSLRFNRASQLEQLNFTTGTQLFNK